MSNKENKLKEFKLRRLIRKAIKIKEHKQRTVVLQEEKTLRKAIRFLVKEEIDSDTNPAPYESTAMNILADVLEQSLPILKTGLRKLSKPEERASYRKHVLEKIINLFSTIESLDVQGKAIGETDLADDVEIKIKAPDGMVVPPSEKERFEPKEKSTEEKEEESYGKFALQGENPTGARAAFETLNNSNIPSIIANKRKVLYDIEDKEEFKKYCIFNIDLWLITYEDDISDELGQEPAFTEPMAERPSGSTFSTAGKKLEDMFAQSQQSMQKTYPRKDAPDTNKKDLNPNEFEDELEKLLMMERKHVGK